MGSCQLSMYCIVLYCIVALNLFNGGVNIDLNCTSINRNYQTKFLGVLIDQDLQWNSHFNYISRKFVKYVGIIYKVRSYLTMNI